MAKNIQKLKDKGFTLIEVVIVMAIGALIILVVVQAIGSARKAQRDSERKQDTARFTALLESYKANVGSYPATASVEAALNAYDSAMMTKYVIQNNAATCAAQTPGSREIRYLLVNAQQYTVWQCLEAGGMVQLQV